MNTYNYNEDGELIVTHSESKSIDDVQRVISINKPQAVIDKVIDIYLKSTEPNNLIADKWYKQHLLVESNDINEVRFTRTFIDENDVEQTETLPNTYDIALAARTLLEVAHDWLKSYRGLTATVRPEFVADVQAWKDININYSDARQRDYIKSLSTNGTFENAVGNTLDTVLKFVTLMIPTFTDEQLASIEFAEISEVLAKVKNVKIKHPKK